MNIVQNNHYFTNHAVQLLPPQYQEEREREAIKNDPRLRELLSDQIIQEIRKIETGYIVVTDSSELQVDVNYLPPKEHICGPALFELVFHTPTPK